MLKRVRYKVVSHTEVSLAEVIRQYSMLPSIRTLQFKIGPEKIYLVLNMTKDSLTFLPLFPSRN